MLTAAYQPADSEFHPLPDETHEIGAKRERLLIPHVLLLDKTL